MQHPQNRFLVPSTPLWSGRFHLCKFENLQSGQYMYKHQSVRKSTCSSPRESESGLESVREVCGTQESVRGFQKGEETGKRPVSTLTGTSVQSTFQDRETQETYADSGRLSRVKRVHCCESWYPESFEYQTQSYSCQNLFPCTKLGGCSENHTVECHTILDFQDE